jgi:hypothetical protein
MAGRRRCYEVGTSLPNVIVTVDGDPASRGSTSGGTFHAANVFVVFISRAHPCFGNGNLYRTGVGFATRVARLAPTTATPAEAQAHHHDNDRATGNRRATDNDSGADTDVVGRDPDAGNDRSASRYRAADPDRAADGCPDQQQHYGSRTINVTGHNVAAAGGAGIQAVAD